MRSAFDPAFHAEAEKARQGQSGFQAGHSEKKLDQLLLDLLRDVYYAERQVLKTLPKMAKAVTNRDFRTLIENHVAQTEGHVERLELVFELIGKPARGKTSDAILGILEEGKSIMEDFKGSAALDLGIASALQAVEHYGIARYGTLSTWSGQLGYAEVKALFDANLAEELDMDQALTHVLSSDDGATAVWVA